MVDGKRRYLGLKARVDAGELAPDAPVAILWFEGDDRRREASLAANIERESLHPIHEFEAIFNHEWVENWLKRSYAYPSNDRIFYSTLAIAIARSWWRSWFGGSFWPSCFTAGVVNSAALDLRSARQDCSRATIYWDALGCD